MTTSEFRRRLLRMLAVLPLCAVLLAGLALSCRQASTNEESTRGEGASTRPFTPPANAYLLAQEGEGFVEEIDGQIVVHLKGTYAEMGRQHGKMCAEKVKECLEWFLYDTAVPKGLTVEKLLEVYAQAEPHIPQSFKDELKATAEAAGISVQDYIAANMIPEKWHCTGSAAWGKATADGKLYHHRSLDYDINIGKRKRAQENAALIVYEPTGETPYVVVGWVGFLGCVTGMNAKGIGIGEMGSSSEDESYAGLPMTFMLREILAKATTLDEGMKLFRELPRTCGFNFILSDGKIPEAVAVEVTHSKIAFFRQDDPAENLPPHTPMKCAVRRCNHFISPDLAATQRKIYDPIVSEQGSWLGYKMITDYFTEHYGALDGQMMIGLCRQYPPTHSCLHQAVLCPTDLRMWVANAADPKDVIYAGAQNQRFYEYNLGDLVRTKADMLKPRPKDLPMPASSATARKQTGKCTSRELRLDDVKDAKLLELLKPYNTPVEEFEWKMKCIREGEDYTVWEVSFPSPMKSGCEENDTVWARYFWPNRQEKMPATVLLHHLEDDTQLEEFIAASMAGGGIPALMVFLPYYGKRAPKDRAQKIEMVSQDMDATVAAFRQGVCDVRRAGDWLARRAEIDPNRIAVTGVSLGGLCAALVAGVDRNFWRCVPIIAGGDISGIIYSAKLTKDIREALEKQGYTVEKLRAVLEPIEPLTFAGRVGKGSVLMINAKYDEIIPKASTQKLSEKFGGVEVVWYEANHETMLVHIPDIIKKVCAFVGGK
ncbi:MAG: C45 family autoproteolytic acyltransferase/hydrolase [Planctomycetota bacterium]|nr:C45 family autoproteolytic acyltransferase/hydrolase [Planctomycetota bacterium]